MKRLKLTLIGLASVGVILSQHMPLHASESDMAINTAKKPVIALSEPVATTDSAEIYGANLNSSATKTTLAELMTRPKEWVEKPVYISTEVKQVCQKKGCFIIAEHDGSPLRIAFKDYGFFLPTDVSGKTIEMTGVLISKKRSEAAADHFNQDLGRTKKLIAAGDVFEFEADAVSIPKDAE